MDAIFKKLNYKNHQEVFIMDAPESFEENIDSIRGTATIKRKVGKNDAVSFVMAFATKQSQVDDFVKSVAPKLEGDAVVWVCYPKGTSKNYKCEFNRDTGWAKMGEQNLEGVRMVAIDADWSALRFRKIEYIKNFTRRKSMALSKEGKKRGRSKD